MFSFDHPLYLLLAIPFAAIAVWIWRTGYTRASTGRARAALGVRLAIIACVVLGLAGANLLLPRGAQAVAFVADLSASDAQQSDAIRNEINAALAQRGGDSQAAIITAGRDAQVDEPPSSLPRISSFETVVDPNYTDLERGLELASAVLPSDYRRRVVLISDGRSNAGDALAGARLLHSLGVRVDVSPVTVGTGPEVSIDAMSAPAQLRPQERFSVGVTVRSTVATTASLTIERDHTLILSRPITVPIGTTHLSFGQRPLNPGFHSFSAHITPLTDTRFENNRGSAFTMVQGPPKVLVVAEYRSEASNVMTSLKTTGIHADFHSPADLLPSLSYLQPYAAVVLVDTAADLLPPGVVDQFVPYVRDLGHGLVVIGGRETYGMGGYGQTPLEAALPVKMDLPKRKDLPSAAVALVIENLEADYDVNISKQAGKGVVNLLTQQDQVLVDDGQGNGHFAVRLQYVRDKQRINNAIDAMSPGDPESYGADLQAAAESLRHTKARVKHIILLGDGDAEDPGYENIMKAIRKEGITTSTVATNGLGFNDFQTMENIAKWGGGRYYRGDQTNAIPRIFLREARTVARSGIVEGNFYPQMLSSNPMLRDLTAVPPLQGYVATTPKPTGEMVLVSKKLDPVLAAWQFGLGRSVAWTSDAAGLWTRDWLRAPGANRFWANLVSWTLPATNGGKLFLSTGTTQGLGTVSVDTPSSVGANPRVLAHVLGPDLKSSTIELQPSAPGHYTGTFRAGAEGSYFITAEAHGAGHAEAGQAGLDVPYSAEYRDTGTDMPFLKQLAAAGGGTILSGPSAAWADNLPGVRARTSLQGILWLLALLLLPIDIGIRRLVVTRRDLRAIRDALTLRPRWSPSPQPAVAPLGAVRASREGRRAAPRVPASAATHSRTDPPLRVPTRSAPPPNPAKSEPGIAQPVAPPAAQGAETPATDTASRLLAAKKRRKT